MAAIMPSIESGEPHHSSDQTVDAVISEVFYKSDFTHTASSDHEEINSAGKNLLQQNRIHYVRTRPTENRTTNTSQARRIGSARSWITALVGAFALGAAGYCASSHFDLSSLGTLSTACAAFSLAESDPMCQIKSEIPSELDPRCDAHIFSDQTIYICALHADGGQCATLDRGHERQVSQHEFLQGLPPDAKFFLAHRGKQAKDLSFDAGETSTITRMGKDEWSAFLTEVAPIHYSETQRR